MSRHALLLVLSLLPALQCADGHDFDGWDDEDRTHDRARRAKARGEILSLAQIYLRAAEQVPGRVLAAELEREGGRWVYELKILAPGGRLLQVDLDAGDGRVIGEGD